MSDQARKEGDRANKQMFNLDDKQTSLQTSLMDTSNDEEMITPIESGDSLNL